MNVMTDQNIPLLIISGPVGVGKTSVGHEISNLLDGIHVSHTFVDLDALTQTFPRPAGDRFGNHLAHTNLTAIWPNCRDTGSRNIIVARVIETAGDVENIATAIPDSVVTICQLTASEENLTSRVRAREIGIGQDRHVDRALELAQSLSGGAPCDLSLNTDNRQVTEIAQELADSVDWNRQN